MTSIELQTRVKVALTEALSVPVLKYVQEYKGRNGRPFVVYQEISNVPALHADGREMGFRISASCGSHLTTIRKDMDLQAVIDIVDKKMYEVKKRRKQYEQEVI